ncbi:hypothetical protein [Stenomitos frigidus]|uniref:Uncharacterized protein n=1 Tax=Stenomitos frigidus ULC18 TaxID=2107698 RepID=A0A2T1ECX4_9CYAN|nr:hypothetical protein [Stenomitos frigidus]PSB30580.1 hypothetical protein C7B82_08520 [Stenomitos frigidus ULC18]
MPYPYSPTPNPGQALDPTLSVPATSTNPVPSSAVTGLLVVTLTISLALAAFGYKKYRAVQRSRLLKRQVAMLEAMWRMSSTKRKF